MGQTAIFILVAVVGGLILLRILLYILGIRVVRPDEVCVVEKWWSSKGSLKDQIIALNAEAGYQPDVLRGGIHLLTPFMYKLHTCELVTIPQGEIGYVFARDGKPLSPTQTLGKVVNESNNFQDCRAFLENGGEKGPQRQILREGTYAFNLAQFIIITRTKTYYMPIGIKGEDEVIKSMHNIIATRFGFSPIIIEGSEDAIGVVTVMDGPSLSKDEIIAPPVGDSKDDENYHNNFQNPEAFLRAGGFRGRQYQVISDGTYFINCLFATVEKIPKTTIPVGNVGVVVSYYGSKGIDVSGESYKHGELVARGCKGVWSEPLMPGKYAFNTYAGKVEVVPTTNMILKWVAGETGGHSFDSNLKEVSAITKDAFEPSLPLSVVINVDYKKAPLVIQRFGSIKMLVEQSLDPMVGSYFKNIGQTRTLIQLIQERGDIQKKASEEMQAKFAHYNLELEEVLIGTPKAGPNDTKIDTILAQLRDRQVAREQIETYQEQQKAREQEKLLNEAEAKSKQQEALTKSSIEITVSENQGKAEYQRALQDAEKTKALAKAEAEKNISLAEAEAQKTQLTARAEADKQVALAEAEARKVEMLAEAESKKVQLLANAESERVKKVGLAQAEAIRQQVSAYGNSNYLVVQEVMGKVADAIKESGVDIVPRQVISSNGESKNAFESLLTLLMSDKVLENDKLKK